MESENTKGFHILCKQTSYLCSFANVFWGAVFFYLLFFLHPISFLVTVKTSTFDWL